MKWHSEGLRGYRLIMKNYERFMPTGRLMPFDASKFYGRFLVAVLFLIVMLANALAFVLSLIRLSGVEIAGELGGFVIVATCAGFFATAVVPMLSRSKGLASMWSLLANKDAWKMIRIMRDARSSMTSNEERELEEWKTAQQDTSTQPEVDGSEGSR